MSDHLPVLLTAGDAPVTLPEFKKHCRIDGTDDDAVATIYLAAACAYVEKWTGRQVTESSWSQQFDGFARSLRLDVSPLSAIDEVTYLDGDGVEQTVTGTNYFLVNGSAGTPELQFIDDYEFPDVQDQRPVLTVEMTAGYEAEAPEAAIVKALVLLVGGDLYANREGRSEADLKPNGTVRSLMDLLRTKWMA